MRSYLAIKFMLNVCAASEAMMQIILLAFLCDKCVFYACSEDVGQVTT